MKKFLKKIISSILAVSLVIPAGVVFAADSAPVSISLNCVDDAGDYAFFDSDYCYTSGNPQYTNMTSKVGNNMLRCYRLDYTNPKRKNYIYMERTNKTDPCYFDISLPRAGFTRNTGKIYSNVLINADIRYVVGGADVQLFKLSGGANGGSNSDLFTPAELKSDGTLCFSDGSRYDTGMIRGNWYNYKIFLNLASHTADIYFEGKKIKSGLPVPSGMARLNVLNFTMNTGAVGDFYLDNLRVVGLIKPYVDGVETPTSVFPEETQVRAYMSDKTGFHAYGNLLCKNNIKTVISPEVIYDRDNNELYVDTATLGYAFDTTVSVNGTNVTAKGKNGQLAKDFKVKDGVTYLPLTEFAKLIGKYTYVHQTGIFVVSDTNHVVKGNNWTYQSFRADSSQVTPMNDIDHLNAYLQYERPSADTLMKDYIKYTGDSDFTAHPRLLVSAEDFAYLKEKATTDSMYHSWYNSMVARAQGYLSADPVQYEFEDAMRAMTPGNTMLTRIFHWGDAYNMTGEQKYVDRAFKEIQAAATFPDYNTSHIIDAGTYVMALAVAYDWFYNGFTPEQREFAGRVCLEQGLRVLASGMYGRLTSTSNGTNMWGAFRWRSNYNSIIVGGVINAALATADIDPDYCFEIISLGLRSLEYSLMELMPGGGWNEAPGYWNYAFQFFNYSFATMNSAFGTDYGLTRSMGMESTLDFAISTLGAYGTNNFHDAGISVGVNSYSAFAYLARRFRNKTAFEMRLGDIKTRRATPGIEDVLFYCPELYEDVETNPKTVNYTEGIELFSVRDSMDSAESSFFFSTHFGTTSGYHQHTDTSAFVLDMYDIRWAEDLGSENYNLQNEQGYGDNDLYRKRGEGHNIIVINPAKYGPTHYENGMPKGAQKEQVNNKFIPIARREYNDSKAIVTTDMTPAYSDVKSMQTGYLIDREKQTVTMRSEFELNERSEVYWFMHTSADISIDGNTAILSKADKKIKVQVSANAMECELLNMEAKPLPTSPQVPAQNANSGYRKLAVKLNSDDYTTLTVRISPVDDEGRVDTTPIDMWRLTGGNEASEVLAGASDHNTLSAYAVADYEQKLGGGGKLPDDENIKFADTEKCISVNTDSSKYKRYVTFSVNVMTEDVGTKVCITNGNKAASDYPVLDINRWNNIKLVVDTEKGKAATVVNGKTGNWYDYSINGSDYGISTYGSGNKVICIDDLSVSTANEQLSVVYPSLDKVFEVQDGYIRLQDGLTAEYISRRSEIAEVTAFADASLAQQLPADTQLAVGNVVIVSNGEYSVAYIVGEVPKPGVPDISWISSASDNFAASKVKATRASWSTVYGVCGKNSGDGVWQLAYDSAQATAGESDIYLFYNLNSEQAAGIVTFELDVYPTDKVNSFIFATGTHKSISKNITKTQVNLNDWNRVRYVYDATAKTGKVYVNDVIVETVNNVTLKSNALRFLAFTQKTSDSVYYVDNVNLYTGKLAQHPVTSTVYDISSNSITVSAGDEVYDVIQNLKKRFDIYDICIYNKNGVVALNRDSVEAGMTLVVKDGNNVLRQYSLK